MIKSDAFGKEHDNENPKKIKDGGKRKKNAWRVFGYRLPPWLVPRKRNKKDGKPITRAKEEKHLPVNKGVAPNEYTKEN